MHRGANSRGRTAAGNERVALDKSLLEAFSKALDSVEHQRALLLSLAPRDTLRLIGLVSAELKMCLGTFARMGLLGKQESFQHQQSCILPLTFSCRAFVLSK